MRRVLRLAVALLLFLFPSVLMAQERTITGTVISDDNKTPLAGVTISVKGTERRTQTDLAGNFSIRASATETLQFSYVGYEGYEVRIGESSTLSINLKLAAGSLGEVVVTAYGIRREKKSLGYSTQVVAGEDLAETRRDNFFNSLAGRVAGATITPTSGVPGASSQIVLRGATSIGGNNQPLIVVDGVPFDNQSFRQEALIGGQSVAFTNRNSDYGNRAADINPEDIENVTILKGPEATALYGSDGASGAIVITTRKGKGGRATLSYDNSFRVEELYRFPEIQTQYTIGSNGVYDPTSVVNPFSILGTAAGAGVNGAFGPKIPEGAPRYNNIKNFFRSGFTQQHNVNVESGNDITTYRLSAGYLDQKGIVPNTGFEKLTMRMTGSTKFGKARLSTSLTYVNTKTDKATKGAGGYVLTLLAWPVESDIRRFENPDGTKIPIRNITNYTLEYDNPLWDVNKNISQDKVDRLTGNVNLTADITKWLNVAAIVGVDYYTQSGYLVTNPLSRFGFASNGFYSLYTQTTRNISNTYRATATKNFGKFSNSLTAGFYFEDNNTKTEAQKGERFYERDFYGINNTDPLSRDAKTTVTKIRKVRFFGNYVLGFNNYLYLSLAGSREGVSTITSRIVDKDPFFNYGSGSLSFAFSDVPGVKDALPWLSFGKGRVSYATTGKGPISPYIIDYRFTNQITTGGGYAYDVTGNNFNIVPEKTKSFEYGVELAAFNNRVRLDVARYSLRSRNQILAARASYGTGFVIKWFNGGEVENKGIEVQLGVTPFKNSKFTWESNFNFAHNQGKIVSMPVDLPTFYDSDTWVFGNLRSQYYKGANIGNMGANTLRRNNAGQVLISPTTGMPLRDENFVTVGDRQPDFTLGWINRFTYKSFNLSFNIDFRKGGDVFNGTEYFLYLTGYSVRTLDRDNPRVIEGVLADGLENTSNPTKNTIVITPSANSGFYSSTTTAVEEDFVEKNIKWARLRDVTLSYALPKKWLSRVKFVRGASVFFTGTDLFMITNYSGADPSVNANTAGNTGFGGAGIDFGALSIPRGFNFGCSIQF
ncbi:SusC/RagA family TonB-linked outer membrane protein [Terrimonas sp. NA20]|uniref:SusC/RagA family TonB-linked outer membrane protein n=1 Tax=Terrimonas ginsenosidimutans TaxID=2908004 RepID=A0ABS9KW66_9BACT|nr:SusC/RagA family TonB-linked outer membrane protein [Terrimonas ginsenosidimutans]MCG2616565.1 SusC/RagA family TonB-linked outer membrane protein [Terrimonas ginsenosidimutans]